MFWRFGGYANISTIDTILEKENFTLEELLDEADLIQELKQHNAKLVEYLRDQNVLEKLLKYVIAPRLEPVAAPNDDDEEEDVEGKGKSVALFSSRPRASSNTSSRATDMSSDDGAIEKKRNRYAFVASEILSSDNWSIYESVMESRDLLRQFWQFLKRPTPLDPLQASYFTKVNESLFDKKTEDMLALLKSLDGAVPDMLKHVDCPMIMDLLLRIISLERTESGQGTVEWLYTQDVMPTLLSFLGPEHSWATQTSAGDFLKAIITVSANASQNEQTCIGPNELTRQLVSKPCVKQLIKYMLGGGNPLTCGVGIIIEVIRKNNSDYDPDGASPNSLPSSRDPIYLGTLLRLFAQHIPDFMNLIMNVPAQQDRKLSTFGKRIEPLGFDRFKTCELMAELLHCSNMGLLNEPGSEEFIAARDAQRQRMREEGRFMPLRVDEPPSTEDLTMRSTQSTAATEGRRLEVTNSSVEDDGFEEVTADDSTHGIEELPEGSAPISSTSLDDDDFVDESLDSSPRFEFAKLETSKHDNSQDFEHSDLVVRPLSPTKKAAEDAENSAAIKAADADKSPAKEAASFTKEKQSQEQTAKSESCESSELEGDGKPSTTTRTETALPVTTLESDPIKAPQLAEATAEKSSTSGDISPRPEDTPAPLFSGQGAPAAPSQAPAKDDTTQPKETTSPNVVEVVGESAETSATEIKTKQPQGVEVSIVVDPVDDETILLDESQKAVVGDFLKMKFVEYDVVPTILRFFFAHPWNNFLHNVVYDIVQQVFNGPMDRGYNPTLAISLFEAADITNQIINGQRASEKSEREHKTRMGYMGHLTLIAEEVVKFTERNPPELLKNDTVMDKVMAQEWINYVEGPLAETRERDNAILGGVRPEVASNNRAQASSLASAGLVNISSTALQEAGLMGSQHLSDNSGGGEVGPFAISSGTTLSSGFGSSSDEEDDEEQENEEDVNNEFRAYTDPLNASSSSSMHPPSIPPPPPPPPPLNVPPSRARLQLAARLAMNKRNAAAVSANGEEGASPPGDDDCGSGSFGSPETSDRQRNPFADDEDDEHGGSGSGSGSDGEVDNGDDDDVGSSAWNRGSWWRGVVRTARRSNRKKDEADKTKETERFGDGRDDSDESDDAVDEDEVDEEMEDEEFGDFAMPEVEGSGRDPSAAASSGGMVSGIDPSREKILLKPLPVHPSSLKPSVSPFGSLWPFSGQGFGSAKDKKEDALKDVVWEKAGGESADQDFATVGEKVFEEPVELDEEGVLGEDGKRIDRAVEAKRRTSIEDPDDDEVVVGHGVGEEVIVGRHELA